MNRNRNLWAALGLFGIAAPLYLIPNHYPIFPPKELSLTWIDQWVPFWPESIWIYLSEYPFLFSAFLLLKKPESQERYLKNTFILLSLSAVTFFMFPTTYPRHLFPLPSSMDSFSRFLFDLQRAGDTPNNCFPSLHVGTVFLAALSLKENKKYFFVYLAWALAIAFSTLTTKQHYVWDVIGGAFFGILLDKLIQLNQKSHP
jgi:membrane-associated phospholipid phosphatase